MGGLHTRNSMDETGKISWGPSTNGRFLSDIISINILIVLSHWAVNSLKVPWLPSLPLYYEDLAPHLARSGHNKSLFKKSLVK